MSAPQSAEPQYDSLFALITQRLYWFFIGPMFLVLMLLGVLNGEAQQLPYFNLAFLVGLALLPVSRWLELSSGQAVTADGKPATWTHWRNYSLTAVGIGLAALAAADTWVLSRPGQ